MKIIDERKDNKANFGDLSIGDVFRYDDCVYMKTYRYSCNTGDINAISLEDCDDIFLTYEDIVEPLVAELIIRG